MLEKMEQKESKTPNYLCIYTYLSWSIVAMETNEKDGNT